MKKYPKHYKATSNEWIPHKQKMEWQCCDCGSVHNVKFRLNLLDVSMTRNAKETKKARGNRKIVEL
jgi:hypothetical protein